jgi:hypothetical protein
MRRTRVARRPAAGFAAGGAAERPAAPPAAGVRPAARAPAVSLERAERLGHRVDVVQMKSLSGASHMKSGASWTATVDGQGRVTKVVAKNLQLKSGHSLPGSGHNSPSKSPPGWSWLNTNKLTHGSGPPNYVRMHMLNGQIGGPGNDVENLTPGTASLNTHHEKNFESEAKLWLAQGGEIETYTVQANYQGASGNLGTLGGKGAWENTAVDLRGDFDYVHYTGGPRQVSSANPFVADEDAGLDTRLNWLGF